MRMQPLWHCMWHCMWRDCVARNHCGTACGGTVWHATTVALHVEELCGTQAHCTNRMGNRTLAWEVTEHHTCPHAHIHNYTCPHAHTHIHNHIGPHAHIHNHTVMHVHTVMHTHAHTPIRTRLTAGAKWTGEPCWSTMRRTSRRSCLACWTCTRMRYARSSCGARSTWARTRRRPARASSRSSRAVRPPCRSWCSRGGAQVCSA